MFCRLRQCRQILPKLNLSAILLLFLIKRAALGNLKVNFHCAHLHRFFPLKKALSKTHQSSLNLKGGPTSHLGLLPSGKKRKPLLSIVFTTPSVPLVGDRNGAQTATLYGWRTSRGLRQQQSRGFLCGDEPALRKSCLWERRDTNRCLKVGP